VRFWNALINKKPSRQIFKHTCQIVFKVSSCRTLSCQQCIISFWNDTGQNKYNWYVHPMPVRFLYWVSTCHIRNLWPDSRAAINVTHLMFDSNHDFPEDYIITSMMYLWALEVLESPCSLWEMELCHLSWFSFVVDSFPHPRIYNRHTDSTTLWKTTVAVAPSVPLGELLSCAVPIWESKPFPGRENIQTAWQSINYAFSAGSGHDSRCRNIKQVLQEKNFFWVDEHSARFVLAHTALWNDSHIDLILCEPQFTNLSQINWNR
jgi:hypothetical protein